MLKGVLENYLLKKIEFRMPLHTFHYRILFRIFMNGFSHLRASRSRNEFIQNFAFMLCFFILARASELAQRKVAQLQSRRFLRKRVMENPDSLKPFLIFACLLTSHDRARVFLPPFFLSFRFLVSLLVALIHARLPSRVRWIDNENIGAYHF